MHPYSCVPIDDMKVIKAVCARYRWLPSVDWEDLLQEGVCGWLKARMEFNKADDWTRFLATAVSRSIQDRLFSYSLQMPTRVIQLTYGLTPGEEVEELARRLLKDSVFKKSIFKKAADIKNKRHLPIEPIDVARVKAHQMLCDVYGMRSLSLEADIEDVGE